MLRWMIIEDRSFVTRAFARTEHLIGQKELKKYQKRFFKQEKIYMNAKKTEKDVINELNKLTPEEAKKIKQDFVSARDFF